MSVPILVLAGGASRRMGARDKLLEPVRGAPLLRIQAERALQASDDVTVLLRPEREAHVAALAGLPVQMLTAPEAIEGMGGSIRAGTAHLSNRPYFLLMLADLVEIETADLQTVIAARKAQPKAWIWRGASEGFKPGHPILFDRRVFPDLRELGQDKGGAAILKRHKDKVHLVPLPGQRALLDLDTPEAWEAWRAAP
jgi:molybdenum cofactor cytidylyltransferase